MLKARQGDHIRRHLALLFLGWPVCLFQVLAGSSKASASWIVYIINHLCLVSKGYFRTASRLSHESVFCGNLSLGDATRHFRGNILSNQLGRTEAENVLRVRLRVNRSDDGAVSGCASGSRSSAVAFDGARRAAVRRSRRRTTAPGGRSARNAWRGWKGEGWAAVARVGLRDGSSPEGGRRRLGDLAAPMGQLGMSALPDRFSKACGAQQSRIVAARICPTAPLS